MSVILGLSNVAGQPLVPTLQLTVYVAALLDYSCFAYPSNSPAHPPPRHSTEASAVYHFFQVFIFSLVPLTRGTGLTDLKHGRV